MSRINIDSALFLPVYLNEFYLNEVFCKLERIFNLIMENGKSFPVKES